MQRKQIRTHSPNTPHKRDWDELHHDGESSQTEPSSGSPVLAPPKRRRLAAAPLVKTIRAMEEELAQLMGSAENVAKEIVKARLAHRMKSN